MSTKIHGLLIGAALTVVGPSALTTMERDVLAADLVPGTTVGPVSFLRLRGLCGRVGDVRGAGGRS